MQLIISRSKISTPYILNPANQSQSVSSEAPPTHLITFCLASTELGVSAFWHVFLDSSAIGSFFTAIARYQPGNSLLLSVLVLLSGILSISQSIPHTLCSFLGLLLLRTKIKNTNKKNSLEDDSIMRRLGKLSSVLKHVVHSDGVLIRIIKAYCILDDYHAFQSPIRE